MDTPVFSSDIVDMEIFQDNVLSRDTEVMRLTSRQIVLDYFNLFFDWYQSAQSMKDDYEIIREVCVMAGEYVQRLGLVQIQATTNEILNLSLPRDIDIQTKLFEELEKQHVDTKEMFKTYYDNLINKYRESH